MPEASRALCRSQSDRKIAGVLGGLARYFALDSTLVRVVYVVVSILSAAFPGILVYLVLWFLIPPEGTATSSS